MPGPAATTAYRRRAAECYDAVRFTTPSGLAVHRIEFDLLKQAVRDASPKGRLLEVGCGTGRLLLPLLEAGHEVDGLDASPEMLAQCRSKLEERGDKQVVRLECAEAARIPFPDASYPFAYSIRLLNQTKSRSYALDVVSDMLRVVRRGGHVLVEFVNSLRPHRLRRSCVSLRPGEVLRHAMQQGAEPVWCRGAFLLGMTTLHHMPPLLLDRTLTLERLGGRLLPKLCARCYLLLRKW